MPHPSSAVLALAAALSIAASVAPASAQSQARREGDSRPLSLDQTERLLRSGVAPSQIGLWVRTYCRNFRMTMSVEDQLRDAGADDRLIDDIWDACVRRTPPPETQRTVPESRPAPARPDSAPEHPEPDERRAARARDDGGRRAGRGGDDGAPRRNPAPPRDGLELWRATALAAVLPGSPWMRRPETRAFGQAVAIGVGGALTLTMVSAIQHSGARSDHDRAVRDGAPPAVLDDRRERRDAIGRRYQVAKLLTAAAWLGQIALAARTWAPADEASSVARARRIRIDVEGDAVTGSPALRVGYIAPFAALR